MRDMLGFASHVEVCGIAGICGICGTDHLLEITPAGLPFLGPPPPIQEGRKMGTENNQRSKKKRMLIFDLTCCLSII
jgi:hypothetical protein